MEAAPDAVDFKALHFAAGKTSLQASGNVVHFANPQWKLTADGTVELAELTTLGAVDGLKRGSIDLELTAQGTGATQYVVDGSAKIVNLTYSIPEDYVLDGRSQRHHSPAHHSR